MTLLKHTKLFLLLVKDSIIFVYRLGVTVSYKIMIFSMTGITHCYKVINTVIALLIGSCAFKSSYINVVNHKIMASITNHTHFAIKGNPFIVITAKLSFFHLRVTFLRTIIPFAVFIFLGFIFNVVLVSLAFYTQSSIFCILIYSGLIFGYTTSSTLRFTIHQTTNKMSFAIPVPVNCHMGIIS